MNRVPLLICVMAVLLACAMQGKAQPQNFKNREYEVIVYVSNINGEAISGIVISIKGKGSQSKPTDGSGRTILKLQGQVNAGEAIDLVLPVDVKENEGWEILPNYRPLIPALNDNPNSHTTLVLKEKSPDKGKGSSGLIDILKKTETYQAESKLYNAYLQIGHLAYNSKHYHEAFAAYEKALIMKPDSDECLYYAALALLRQDKHREALPHIEKCLLIRKQKPASVDLAQTYDLYSDVLRGLQREEEAEKQKALASEIRSRLPK